jgi:hypothetical protein
MGETSLTGPLTVQITEQSSNSCVAPSDCVGSHCHRAAAKDIATILGIGLAGLWTVFLLERRRSLEPRAMITHRAHVWEQYPREILRLSVEVSNPSEVAIRPGDGTTRVQRPPSQLNPHTFAPDAWIDVEKIRHCLGYEDVHIEPKESETFTHDVELPVGVRYLQIATEMACERTKDMKNRADGRPTAPLELSTDTDRWTVTTLIDLAELRAKTGATSPIR